MKKIKEVGLNFPNAEDGSVIYFKVGVDDVTEIKKAQRGGEFCDIDYYEIYKNGKLFHEMHQYGYVEYEM